MTATSFVSFKVRDDVKAELEQVARANQRTRSGEIRYALDQYLAAARAHQRAVEGNERSALSTSGKR